MSKKQIEVKINATRKLVFSVFKARNNKELASVREFYLDGEEWKPGKSGMTLPPEKMGDFARAWKQLHEVFAEKDED